MSDLTTPEPEQAHTQVIEAAMSLLAKLDIIHNDPKYQGVWQMYHIHGLRYDGPKYDTELEVLRAALASLKGAKS